MTVDEIMALADEFAAEKADIRDLDTRDKRYWPQVEQSKQARAALRAAVEQIVRERDDEKKAADHWMKEANTEHNRAEHAEQSLSAWEQVWEGIRDNHESNLNPTNKPLAVAAIFQLAINRAERAEQEHQFQAALVKELLPYQERAVRAEQERDELKVLLALKETQYSTPKECK